MGTPLLTAEQIEPDTPSTFGRASALDPISLRRLRQLQLSSLLGHVASATVISTTFALVLSLYLAPVFGQDLVRVWFGLKVLSALPRFVFAQAYRLERFRTRISLSSANAFLLASLIFDGVVWGLAGLWGIGASTDLAPLMLACMVSVAMLATFGLQVRQLAVAAFVLPVTLPMAMAALMRGDAFGFFATAAVALIVVQALVTGYASERRVTREFVAREQTAIALLARSDALQLASQTSTDLERALLDVRRQSAAKAVFLGTMSHELRTPLHGILGMTELVQRQVADPSVKHRLKLIESSGKHLLELIGALLDVSRIDSGHLQLHIAPFDLTAEVLNLAELYEVRAQGKGVGFRCSIDLGDACWVRGDAARVRQILHNLLGNALKFTDKGLVRFVATRAKEKFVFEVADTGPGISATDLPRIFEAFHQADDTAARPADGTGLGLTIARELARAMGGDITVSTALGVGSRFGFAVKLEPADPISIPDPAAKVGEPLIPLSSSYHVLLVEDNDVNAIIAAAHLEHLGLKHTRVFDGKQAVDAAFGAERPDLILMDCRMPTMDGPTATREIRTMEKTRGKARVPIVALTATPSEEERRLCFESGMDGFLMKPFTDRQLRQAICSYVETTSASVLQDHPLYEFAKSLDDTEPDLLDGRTMH